MVKPPKGEGEPSSRCLLSHCNPPTFYICHLLNVFQTYRHWHFPNLLFHARRRGGGGKAYSRSWIRIHWANSERVAGRFYCKSCFYWGVYDDNCLVCERVSWLLRPGSKLINKAIKQLAGAGRPNLDKTSPVANSSGFHIYILLLVDMGRWGVISQLPLCSSPSSRSAPGEGSHAYCLYLWHRGSPECISAAFLLQTVDNENAQKAWF